MKSVIEKINNADVSEPIKSGAARLAPLLEAYAPDSEIDNLGAMGEKNDFLRVESTNNTRRILIHVWTFGIFLRRAEFKGDCWRYDAAIRTPDRQKFIDAYTWLNSQGN